MSAAYISMRVKNVRIKPGALTEPGSAPYLAAERAGKAAVKHVQREIVMKGLVDTTGLYRSIDYEVIRSGKGLAIIVGPFKGSEKTKEYAKYVEFGTKGPITSKSGKLMPVQIKGGPLLFLRKVRGQKAQHYIRDGLKRVRANDFGGF